MFNELDAFKKIGQDAFTTINGIVYGVSGVVGAILGLIGVFTFYRALTDVSEIPLEGAENAIKDASSVRVVAKKIREGDGLRWGTVQYRDHITNQLKEIQRKIGILRSWINDPSGTQEQKDRWRESLSTANRIEMSYLGFLTIIDAIEKDANNFGAKAGRTGIKAQLIRMGYSL